MNIQDQKENKNNENINLDIKKELKKLKEATLKELKDILTEFDKIA